MGEWTTTIVEQAGCRADRRAHACAVVLALALLCTGMPMAKAQGRAVGTLTCRANAAIEFATNSNQRMRCQFASSLGRTRGYSGVIARFEAVPGLASGRFMRWSVHTNARPFSRGALVGRYVAARNVAAPGAGVDGADLLGGRAGSEPILLRPSSATRGRTGVNLAPGVKEISIRR